ncbi:MAG: hypothetical protein V4773_16605 [Verrucomicrobiota bacterium]
MGEQHQRFLSRLGASSRAVFAVALAQHLKGRAVEIPPLAFAPDAREHSRYVDGGDLYVTVGESRLRFEVKHLGVEFTCRSDWPFREVFVSNAAAVERAEGSAKFYVSVNKSITHAAVISDRTSGEWYIREARARNTGNFERYYACPLELVSFERLTFDV